MEVRSIVLGPDEPYELRLVGRGARGYVWTWQVTGDADAVSVAEAPAATAAPAPGAAPSPGAPVERTYLIRARHPGEGRYKGLVLKVQVPPATDGSCERCALGRKGVRITSGAAKA
ncbi:hypothetical protein, partial [Streptomyces virginiae]|uniref:hypothetical protein n=1 Tax=Streptomyces virginiae TaxID=1961 RepID=UPI0035E0E1E1